jgi:hypothetical protein
MKSSNPLILSGIHHRQNPLNSSRRKLETRGHPVLLVKAHRWDFSVKSHAV